MLNSDQTLTATLIRVEAILAASHAAIVPLLRPGLPRDSVQEQLSAVGVSPAPSLMEWYGWHDGAGEAGTPSELAEVAPGAELLSLHAAVDEYLETRAVAMDLEVATAGAILADQRWPPGWFPIMRLFGKGYIAVDVTSGDSHASPVHVVWHDGGPESRQEVAWPTLDSFCEFLISQFELGVYSIGPNGAVKGPTLDKP